MQCTTPMGSCVYANERDNKYCLTCCRGDGSQFGTCNINDICLCYFKDGDKEEMGSPIGDNHESMETSNGFELSSPSSQGRHQ